MAQTWRTVRVFISSTFRDMQAERDHLVRFIFPELKERCRQRHIQLVDVDLRWGVTEKEAEGGGALDICLDEIDSCRPYFIGLIGHRYGYIPPGNDHSITAEEIYHGVLHNSLPRQLIDLRPFVEGILEGRALFKEQVSCLVRNYQWDTEKRKYLLKQKITPEDQKTLRSVFDVYSIYQKDRSYFFFRSESFTKKLVSSKVDDYIESDKELQNKLANLKKEIKDAKLPCFDYDDLEAFGQKVLETLWSSIDAEFPEKREEIERDWLKEETELHELFLADRTQRFVGRSDILLKMHNFVEENSEPRLMVITGEPGCGKSALMARFTERIMQNHPDWLVLSHFVGASATSTNLRQTLKRLCIQLNRSLGITEEVPEEYKELAQLFPKLLQRAAEKSRILLVIDALNQLEKTDDAHAMRWLPQKLPQNVKVVVSTLAGEILDTLTAWRIQPQFVEVVGLTEPEIEEFVTSYLEEIRKKFPTPKIRGAFYKKIKAGNPLYILVALEELRVFPVYEEVGKRVASLPETIPELFEQVLERVEEDFTRPLVEDFLSLIACGKQGMTGDELQTLLKKHTAVANSDKLPDMLFARLKRAFIAYLFERSGVIDFFHTQLKEAVGRRYLLKETERDKTHKAIAEYFEQRWKEPYLRALDELPHQLTKAKDWDKLEWILCDLKFIEAKCAGGMTYDLVHDYNNALDALPEAQPEKKERLKQEARVKKYVEDLIAYAKGEIKKLDIIPSVELWSDEKIKQDTERIIKNPTRLDRIKAFSQFVNSESHDLVKFASHPGFVTQQAYNSANSGPVASAAEIIIKSDTDNVMLLQYQTPRLQFNPHSALQKTVEGHIWSVNSVDITPDGKKAISGSEGTLRIWNLDNSECIATLEAGSSQAYCVSITADGKKAVSGYKSGELQLWDLENLVLLKLLQGHNKEVKSVCITPDGKLAASGSTDGSVWVWDLDKGICITTLIGREGWEVGAVGITPDGRFVISGSSDHVVRVWEIDTKICIHSLKIDSSRDVMHAGILGLGITPDGSRAIACCGATLQTWDLKTGNSIRVLENPSNLIAWDQYNEGIARINCVNITPDGKLAVTGSDDSMVRVWDIDKGVCLRTLPGHTSWVETVRVTPEGRLIVSGADDKTLRVWDTNGTGYQNFDKRHKSRINRVSLTPHGNTVVTGGKDGRIGTWDITNGECTSLKSVTYTPIFSISLNPEGNHVIPGSESMKIEIWCLREGKCINTLEGHEHGIECSCYTPDSKRIITGSFDTTLRVWNADTGQCIHVMKGHSKFVRCLKITPDGRYAVSSGDDSTVLVWDLESGQCLHRLKEHNDCVWNIFITPDGLRAVSRGWDGIAVVWDIAKGICLYTLQGKTGTISSVDFTPEGLWAITGSSNGNLRIWDLRNGECTRTIYGHGKSVEYIKITSDGRTAVSQSGDDTIQIWDIERGVCLGIYKAMDGISSLTEVTPAQTFAYGTTSGELALLRFTNLNGGLPVVTLVRLWLYGEKESPGKWDDKITSVCPWCGQRFPVSDKILDVIRTINRNTGLTPDQSPCLELPNEAWDEPKLLSECPLCHKPVKFNPFIVDNKGRY